MPHTDPQAAAPLLRPFCAPCRAAAHSALLTFLIRVVVDGEGAVAALLLHAHEQPVQQVGTQALGAVAQVVVEHLEQGSRTAGRRVSGYSERCAAGRAEFLNSCLLLAQTNTSGGQRIKLTRLDLYRADSC